LPYRYEGSLRLPADYAEGDPIVPTKLVRHGNGTMTFAKTGEVYKGQWCMNERVGLGTSTYVFCSIDLPPFSVCDASVSLLFIYCILWHHTTRV
jgi:hypothetical protein